MTVQELSELLGAKTVTNETPLDREVIAAYTGDLLSWVMTHAARDSVWITVQTHMNVIAVASLLDFSCVIIPEGIAVPEAIAQKADEEGITLLTSEKTSFEISGMLFAKGIAPSRK